MVLDVEGQVESHGDLVSMSMLTRFDLNFRRGDGA